MKDVVFRLDANQEVGAGHLMRCLALMEPLIERGLTVAVQGFVSEQFRAELDLLGVPLTQSSYIESCKCLVVDYYGDLNNVLLLVPHTTKVVVFEDGLQRSSDRVDLLVDACGSIDEYRNDFPNAKIYCGLEYQSFRKVIELRQQDSGTDSGVCLITLGASRQDDLLKRILDALQGAAPIKIQVLGTSELKMPSTVDVIPFSADFIAKAKRTSCVICAAGQTLLELVYCGVPVVGLEIADNQKKCAQALRSYGVTVLGQSDIETRLVSSVNQVIKNGSAASVPQLGRGKKVLVDEIERLAQ